MCFEKKLAISSLLNLFRNSICDASIRYQLLSLLRQREELAAVTLDWNVFFFMKMERKYGRRAPENVSNVEVLFNRNIYILTSNRKRKYCS